MQKEKKEKKLIKNCTCAPDIISTLYLFYSLQKILQCEDIDVPVCKLDLIFFCNQKFQLLRRGLGPRIDLRTSKSQNKSPNSQKRSKNPQNIFKFKKDPKIEKEHPHSKKDSQIQKKILKFRKRCKNPKINPEIHKKIEKSQKSLIPKVDSLSPVVDPVIRHLLLRLFEGGWRQLKKTSQTQTHTRPGFYKQMESNRDVS